MTLIQLVRSSLRLDTEAFDGELHELIEAAKEVLEEGGADAGTLDAGAETARVKQAIVAYVKGHFGRVPVEEAERYDKVFAHLLNQMGTGGGEQ